MNGIRENIRKLYALADAIEIRAKDVYSIDAFVYHEELHVYANIARKIAEKIELEAKNAGHE